MERGAFSFTAPQMLQEHLDRKIHKPSIVDRSRKFLHFNAFSKILTERGEQRLVRLRQMERLARGPDDTEGFGGEQEADRSR